jgi:hypothetical protein
LRVLPVEFGDWHIKCSQRFGAGAPLVTAHPAFLIATIASGSTL